MKPSWNYLFYFVAAILYGGCTSPTNDKSEALKVPVVEHKPIILSNELVDYSTFDYNLPQSDYSYKIKITDIETRVAKDAFTTKADEYSVPKKVDGYFLVVSFSMTNPYDKEMMAPVPDYFYISSINDERFSNSILHSRSCGCTIDNSTQVTDDKGNELSKISEAKCGNSDHCVTFKPKETRNFVVNFTDPVFGHIKVLVFWGFNRHWAKPEFNWSKESALIVDIEKK